MASVRVRDDRGRDTASNTRFQSAFENSVAWSVLLHRAITSYNTYVHGR